MSFSKKKLFSNPKNPNSGVVIFTKTKSYFYKDSYYEDENRIKDSWIKYNKDSYVKLYKMVYKNFIVIKKIFEKIKIDNFKLYVALEDKVKDKSFTKEYNKIKSKFTRKKSKCYQVKKSNSVVGHINGLILDKDEKLIKYVRGSFLRKYLLGDIVITKEQEDVLNEYMKYEIKRFDKNPEFFEPLCETLFSFGLIRFAMNNYNKDKVKSGAFWPYFKENYDVVIKPSRQIFIKNKFKDIMNKYKKIYFDNLSIEIDNITLHSFVSTHSANKLFDYIFDFWRQDLNRNANNLNLEGKYDIFNALIDDISNDKVSSVMKHTAILLNDKKAKIIFKNRIKRIIKIIDDSFWNETPINETGNRINHLLNNWIKDSNSAFKREKDYVKKTGFKNKGEIIFHSPILKINNKTDKLYIVFPLHRLKDITNNDNPYWQIDSKNHNFDFIRDSLNENLKLKCKNNFKIDNIGHYLNIMEIEIPLEFVLSDFDINIYVNETLVHSFKIYSSLMH